MAAPLHALDVDYRQHPERYRVGRGEQGVFRVRPYKDELLPLWRFRTPADAKESAAAIRAKYDAYKAAGEFVGMDLARKYLQMGYTRATRYARHRGGRKYAADGTALPRTAADPEKAAAAAIFREAWEAVEADPDYVRMKQDHQRRAGRGDWFQPGHTPRA
ncbi:MAG: DUF4385 domain-containing protein [Gemmataceae bacterium]|nr:DUF4385 domain-containing protein [Gemmataceae bacterium]